MIGKKEKEKKKRELVEVLPAGFLFQRFAARRTPKEKEMEGKEKIGGGRWMMG